MYEPLFDTIVDFFDAIFLNLNFTSSSVSNSLTIEIDQVGIGNEEEENKLQMDISCILPMFNIITI